jgi:hypothetical protein
MGRDCVRPKGIKPIVVVACRTGWRIVCVRRGRSLQDHIEHQALDPVWNEGTADHQDVQIVATLPNSLEFESANDPRAVTSGDGKVTFDPIETMPAGDREEYADTCKPTGNGNVCCQYALTSKVLEREVIGEEPTRLSETSNN